MILAIRYPHVRTLIAYYANKLSDQPVLSILETGLHTEEEAKHLSFFIWKMIEEMRNDREQNNMVLGGIDNTTILADVSYEMDAFMTDAGYSELWERISDEA